MTYYELWIDAVRKLDHNEITLGEYDEMIIPLHREVDTLDKIRAEIEELSSYVARFNGGDFAIHIDKEKVLEIIDKNRGDRHET